MLGKIPPAYFPKVCGPRGDEALDGAVVSEKFAELAAEIARATGKPQTPASVAEGFLRIAVANMANAIKFISVQRGHDVTGYTLACFGGAGGQHACLVADALGMTKIMIHPLAGVLSAYGMGLADTRLLKQETVEAGLEERIMRQLDERIAELTRTGEADLLGQGIAEGQIHAQARLQLKYSGSDSALEVAYGSVDYMTQRFEALYRQRFAFTMPGVPLV